MFFAVPVIALSVSNNDSEDTVEMPAFQSELSQQLLRYSSNQFTLPENEETGSIDINTSTEGFQKVAENENLSLFVNGESLGLKIFDKRTGYVWNSGLDQEEEYNLNETWMNMAQSAVTIEYIDQGGSVQSGNILSMETEIDMESIENKGFKAEIHFIDADISIELEVWLDNDFLEVHVPESGITESETGKLASLRLYSFLGAVQANDIDGYMFIPDGSGALIRFDDDHVGGNAPYQASVYGEDEGFKRTYDEDGQTEVMNPVQNISLPVYGMVHEPNQQALFTIIEDGKYYSDVIAYPAGVSTDFNWITSEYHYRYQYYQPTSQSMSGFNTYQVDRNEFDIKERVAFLAEDDADYVGMAKHYQQYLVDNGELEQESQEVDVRLEFLGGEVKRGLLWDSVSPMTPVTDLPRYVSKLKQQDVENMHVVYRGWSKGGLTGTLPEKFPFESRLGSKGDLHEVIEQFQDEDIPLYFYTDYTKAYEGASGFAGRSDLARKINAETIGYETYGQDYYFLSPAVSLEHAKSDVEDFEDNHISKLAIDTSAGALFSDFNSDRTASPDEVVEIYTEMLQVLNEEVGALSLYRPNDYMWSQMERYLDIPMYSSNYSFVTDTVPFVQIVLKGYKPYYAPFSNFFYNRAEEVLRMVEYGAYPSFYLTTEPSHLLMDSPSRDLYTSEFDDWESEIVRQYNIVQESLGQVEGETIESRHVHDHGVVEVTYSNGKSIIVNYTAEPYEIEDIEIDASWFKVVDRGSVSP